MLKLENSIRGLSFSRVAFDLTIQDNKKAQKDLSFKTTFNLRDGLFKTYEYFKK